MARSAVYPEGHFLGWTPGQLAPLVPPDMAWRLEPGTDLVVQLHMQPSGAPRAGPAAHRPVLRRSRRRRGRRRFCVSDRRGSTFRQARPLHDHRLLRAARRRRRCRRCSRTRTTGSSKPSAPATFPDGRERTLIRIDDWDFRWQHVYRYEQPIALPEGHAGVDALHLRQLAPTIRAIRSSPRSACAGASDRSTRWAICGSSSSPTAMRDRGPLTDGDHREDDRRRRHRLRDDAARATRRTPSCTTMSRCSIWRWAAPATPSRISARRRR